MSIEGMDLTAVIASLENKRAVLDSAIAALRAVISSDAAGATDGAISFGTFASSTSGEVPDGAFHGKTLPAAIKLYLEMVHSKKTAREISDGVKKGGLESTSKFFDKIVYSTLLRLKDNGEVMKIGDAWGLPTWFPALMRTGSGPKAKAAKSRKVRPLKDHPAQTPKLLEVREKVQPRRFPRLKASDAIDLYLQKNPGPHTDEEIRLGTNIGNLRVIQMVLGTLAKNGKVAKTEDGKYEYRKAS